jgi:PilZ domain-containing protein
MSGGSALRKVKDAIGLGRRAAPRYTVLLCVRLLSARGDQPARLRDLSLGGAMIEGDNLPPPGASVVLQRRGFEAFARMIWADGRRAGLAFEQPLTEAQLLAQVTPPPPPSVRRDRLQLVG